MMMTWLRRARVLMAGATVCAVVAASDAADAQSPDVTTGANCEAIGEGIFGTSGKGIIDPESWIWGPQGPEPAIQNGVGAVGEALKYAFNTVAPRTACEFYAARNKTRDVIQKAPQILSEHIVDRCWSCEIVAVFYDASFALGSQFFKQVQDRGLIPMFSGSLLFLWLAWNIAKIYMPAGGPEGQQFWNQVYSVLMWAALVNVLAGIGGFQLYWDWIFTPLFGTFAGLGSVMFDSVKALDTSSFADLTCKSTGYAGLSVAGMTDTTARTTVLCLVEQMHRLIGTGLVLGILDLPTSFSGAVFKTAGEVLGGLFLCVIFGSAFLLFILHVVDKIVRLSIAAVMIPIAMVAYIFPASSNMTKTTFRIVLRAGIGFFLLSSIFGLSTLLMRKAMSSVVADLGFNQLPVSMSGTGDFWTQMGQRGSPGLGLQDVSFWWMAAAGVLICGMLSRIGSVSERFAEYGDSMSMGAQNFRMIGSAVSAGMSVAASPAKIVGGLRKR